jgi:hypothetical protein
VARPFDECAELISDWQDKVMIWQMYVGGLGLQQANLQWDEDEYEQARTVFLTQEQIASYEGAIAVDNIMIGYYTADVATALAAEQAALTLVMSHNPQC